MDWSRTTWSSLAVLMRWIAAKPLAHVEMAGRCPQRIGERTASGSIGKYPKRDFCAAQGPVAEGILSPEYERMGRRRTEESGEGKECDSRDSSRGSRAH